MPRSNLALHSGPFWQTRFLVFRNLPITVIWIFKVVRRDDVAPIRWGLAPRPPEFMGQVKREQAFG